MTSPTTFTSLLVLFAATTVVAASCGGSGTTNVPPPPKTTTASVATSGGGDETTSVGGAGGAGGVGGAVGTGGMGGMVGTGGMTPCVEASSCPGPNTECQTRVCAQGVCGFVYTPSGAQVAAQAIGDCKVVVCDGAGATKENEADDPLDDGNPCTDDLCNAGTPSSAASAPGKACSANGGKVCDGKGACVGCVVGADCASGLCQANKCVPSSCADFVKNGLETDIDCGGADCNKCVDGKVCSASSDCTSKVCAGGTCKAPTCTDGVKNGVETDVDCGGGTCNPCAPTKGCALATDCTSKVCTGGVCQTPLCTDGVMNGGETDPDCGGPACPGCSTGQKCSVSNDCSSKQCVNNKCACPVGMRVAPKVGGGTYCIDTTEVTNGAYDAFLTAGQAVQNLPAVCAYKAMPPGYVPGVWPWQPPSTMTSPVANVDWCDAYAYCAYSGKHLCGKIGGGQNVDNNNAFKDPVQSEWYNACSAQANNVYPYGNTYNHATCVGVDQSNTAALAGSCGANTCAPLLDTALAGYATCQGGIVGLYGMSGNLAEWENSCDDPANPTTCHVRGGSRCESGSAPDNKLRCDDSAKKPITYQDCDVGFRCCF